MPDQQVMWTALPRAATAAQLELDVLVSPRLGLNAPAGTEYGLSDFGELEHWTQTLAGRLTFEVELADGSRRAAAVVPAALDDGAWDHLFRATTFVRPWTFRDLSEVPIYSYSVRFITAYLRSVYAEIGRSHPALPPPRGALDGLRETVGPVTDVRVADERAAPPRDDRELPPPTVIDAPAPPVAPEGCATRLWLWLERIGRLLRPLCRRLPPRVRWALAVLARLLRAVLAPARAEPPPDPTAPKVTLERTVHPSPYGAKAPLGPASLPALDRLEALMAADKAIKPAAAQGAMATALGARDLTFDFARAKRFYERPESEVAPTAPPAKPRMDFHQALGALGDYPELLRRLGLVVTLRCDRPAADPVSVRVIPRWDGAPRESDLCPRTRCTLAGDAFHAAHQPGSEVTDGRLDLGGADDRLATDAPLFDVVQVDADGAALKTIVTAASLERAHQLIGLGVESLARPARETVPALRSGGLALVRADRGWHVHERLVGASAQSAPVPAAGEPAGLPQDLFAEDLVRGYRIEVKPDGGDWLSLCARVGTYALVDDAGAVVRSLNLPPDEGYVKRTSATGRGEGHPLYVHEALARWTGWSLVAQRPGKTLEERPGETPHDQAREPRNEVETEFRLLTSFKAKPRSLPRLRFGTAYALRAVCVDLTGRPVAALPAAGAAETAPVTYRRFEPAGPPAALALRAYLPGESLERIVLRSDVGRDSTTYDQQELALGPADAAAQRTRHVFPPKASQQMAELHGKLDAAFGATGDPAVGYRISLRESGTFSDAKIVDVATVDPADPQRTIPFGTPVRQGEDWINETDATLPTPYLPDPLVAGAALRGVPGLAAGVDGDALTMHAVRAGDDPAVTEPLLQIPFTGDWPDYDAFRIRVAEQTAPGQPPHWSAAERLLTVFLPKAGRAEVRYSACVAPAALAVHGMWDWIDDEDPAGSLRSHAERGAHWMITPSRTLVLVHAVQHPLTAARFTALAATRSAVGQTTAALAQGTLELDVPSTGRIDVVARWTEYLDDAVTGYRTEPREAVAGSFAVDPATWADGMAFPPAPALHEFGDTRHRRVDYLVRATSSFREYLRQTITVPEMVVETAPGDEFEAGVLNSARPAVPGVRYAVPTFDWPSGPPVPGSTAAYTQRRGGGGLRVYLDRPWYETGEGELLGVVLQLDDALPDHLRSRYGLDPIWSGYGDPHALPLEPEHFANRVTAKKVQLQEPGSPVAIVAGFAVEWDAARRCFYSDIAVAVDKLPWSYWPFVRLAFVRFQPASLSAVKVSKVVLGEFGQLAPDRELGITWPDADHVGVRLAGRAPEGPRETRVAFRVQTTDVAAPGVPDALDWAHAAGDAEAVSSESFLKLLAPSPAGGGVAEWQSLVDLPAPRGTQRMRLEVAEYEWIAADTSHARGAVRLVYVGHVPLD